MFGSCFFSKVKKRKKKQDTEGLFAVTPLMGYTCVTHSNPNLPNLPNCPRACSRLTKSARLLEAAKMLPSASDNSARSIRELRLLNRLAKRPVDPSSEQQVKKQRDDQIAGTVDEQTVASAPIAFEPLEASASTYSLTYCTRRVRLEPLEADMAKLEARLAALQPEGMPQAEQAQWMGRLTQNVALATQLLDATRKAQERVVRALTNHQRGAVVERI